MLKISKIEHLLSRIHVENVIDFEATDKEKMSHLDPYYSIRNIYYNIFLIFRIHFFSRIEALYCNQLHLINYYM